jgi:hypothetical protein
MTARSLLASSFLLALHPLLAAPLGAQGGVFETRYTFQGALEGDRFAQSVAGAGDVNGDGFADVIVGAPGMSTGGRIENGVAFVYSGRDGTILGHLEGEVSGDDLGSAVAGIGDVNKDGFDDVMVGAGAADVAGKSDAGSVFVISGKDGAKLWQIHGAAGDLLGSYVAAAGDVNRDGYPDLIVAAPGAGATYVYSGKDGSTLWRFNGVSRSVAGAGDVNRDGYADVIVGAPGVTPSGNPPQAFPKIGAAYVYSGRDGTTILEFRGSAAAFGSWLGASVAGAGDVNRDGSPDLLVGQFVSPGAILYSGRDGTRLWEFEDASIGFATAGDVNQDGYPDVIGRSNSGHGTAFVYVYRPPISRYGTGLAGTGNFIPRIWTGGGLPKIGNSRFEILVFEAVGGSLCAIAGSVVRAET